MRAAARLPTRIRHVIALWFGAIAIMIGGPAMADTLTGRAMIDTRMALPTGLTFEAVIEDISRADAPATVIGRTVIENPGQPPIDFAIDYDPAGLLPGAIYSLRATIRRDEPMRPQVRPPSSCPAKSAFFLFRAIGRMRFSTGLESISTRPSWRKVCSPSQWRWM